LIIICSIVLLVAACRHSQSKPSSKIAGTQKFHRISFLLYENFDTVLLNSAVAEASAFYHCGAVILPPAELPSFAYYEPRHRYKADSLLKFQAALLPAGSQTVIGLTNKDISTRSGENADWGVFGLGFCPGNACVISVFRLKSGSYDQIKERFIKVVLHELGHNMGLPHCNANEYCLMNDAKGTMAQVEKERKWLCPDCRKLLSN